MDRPVPLDTLRAPEGGVLVVYLRPGGLGTFQGVFLVVRPPANFPLIVLPTSATTSTLDAAISLLCILNTVAGADATHIPAYP